MRCVIIAAVVALALARPHPRPARDDVARSMDRERRAEIADALKGASGSLHSVNRKAPHSKGHAKPVDPEAAEKAREMAERNELAVQDSKKEAEALKEELEKKRLAKQKLANDMKLMHKALTDASTTTTTTTTPVDPHILDISDTPEPQAKPALPTPTQLAKMAEEKSEKEEHIREAEEAARNAHAAEQKAQAKAKRLKEQEKSLHSEAQEVKSASPESDNPDNAVKKDEVAASKMLKEVAKIAEPVVAIAKPVELAPPEKKAEVPQAVLKADEEAKKLLKMKTHSVSKAAVQRTKEEIEKVARSDAADLHAAAIEADSKKVDADLKQQMESVKEVKAAQQMAVSDELKEEARARRDILKPHPRQMFRPHPKKFDPNAPEEVAKRSLEDDARREGGLQDKMKDMMGSMEKIREQIGH